MEELKSISDISSSICAKIIEREGLFSADLFIYWDKIAGGYAEICKPRKITTVNGLNNLFISPCNDCSLIDLEYSSWIIMEKINTFFGRKVINNIKISRF